MFLKLKRDGNIKGRTVAGGNRKLYFIWKECASSPTVATEKVLLTCVIDAQEGRDVAIIIIPNAFIQTQMEKEEDMVPIRVRVALVDVLLEKAPEVYKPYTRKDKKGNKILIPRYLHVI